MKMNKILIVDDEKNIRMTISQSLADMDVQTDTAVNGEERLRNWKILISAWSCLICVCPGWTAWRCLRN